MKKRLDERAADAAGRAFPMVSGIDVGVMRHRRDAFRIGYRLGHAAGMRSASKRLSSKSRNEPENLIGPSAIKRSTSEPKR